MVRIKDIASALNLSSATVSRALRSDSTLSITPETRTRIFTVAAEMGYVRPVKTTQETILAKRIMIVHKHQTFRNQIDSSYYYSQRSGIEDACSRHKIGCTFCALEDLQNITWKPDGVLIIGNYSKEQYESLLPICKNIPAVVVGIVIFHAHLFNQVTFSNRQTVSLALAHLFENGHRDIAYLGIEEATGTELVGSRISAFKDVMKAQGCFNSMWVLESDHGSDRVERGYFMTKRLLECPTLPTAIFCANDPIALGAINALLETGHRIPEDFSIISHDGSYPTQYAFPPLTTVDVHPYQLGAEGVEILSNIFHTGSSLIRKVQLYPELISRSSVKKLGNR